MTPQQTLQEVRAKIIEAVPEIMELKFGCEILYEKELYIYIASTGMMTDLHQGCYPIFYIMRKNKLTFDDGINSICKRIHTEYEFEVLGRPINLEDVLGAIMGEPEDATMARYWVEILSIWQLGLTLDQQKTEVWEILNKILSIKK